MRKLISVDNRIRLLIWLVFVVKDFLEYSLPVPAVSNLYVASQIAAARGRSDAAECPFKARRLEQSNELDGINLQFVDAFVPASRIQLYFEVTNIRTLWCKARHYAREMLGTNGTEFREVVLNQLNIQHLLTPLDNELGSPNMPYRYIFIYGSVVAAAIMLFDHANLDPRADVTRNALRAHHFYIPRVLVIAYCVGAPHTAYTVAVEHGQREHDAALFLAWAFVMGVTEFALRFCSQQTEKEAALLTPGSTPTVEHRLSFLRLLVSALFTLFTYVLLAILVVARSDSLSLAYKFMLLADALAGTSRATYVVSRIITVATTCPANDQQGRVSHKQFANLAEDYFEAIFYVVATVYGLFVRRRLMALLLVSHVRFLLQRVAHRRCSTDRTQEDFLL